MKELIDTYTVRAPAEKIAQIHFSPNALKQLTPPGIRIEILSQDPIGENSVTHFKLWFGPLPIEWEAQHQQVSFQEGFLDIQRKGPFRHWKHYHQWKSLSVNETQMTERIEFEHTNNLQGIFTRLLFNPIAMKFFFWYRRKKITRLALS